MTTAPKIKCKLRTLKANLADDITIDEIPVYTDDGITIYLTRFRRGFAKRSILLTHGMTASTDMFVMPEHRNLVSVLLDEGWEDVWSLDWRGSCRLPYNISNNQYTVDDVALYDLPATIKVIRDQIQQNPLYVISHCVSSIAFGIALASGIIQGLAGVIANSVFLTTKLPNPAAFKIASPAPELIQRLFGINYLTTDFSKIGFKSPQALLFAMASATRSQCSNPTCQIISFAWGSEDATLFLHQNLLPQTHDRLAELLGPIPLSYFLHYRKMSLAQTTVPFSDTDISYDAITKNGIASAGCIDTPILLLNGSDNKCWGDSNKICAEILKELHPHLNVTYLEIPHYGHIDVFIGRHSALDVFPHLINWLEAI
jgi:cholesterol oxidase